MPFMGELKQATAYAINVDNAQSSGKTAIVILKINRREKFAAAETHAVAAAVRVTLGDTCGPRIDQVIIQFRLSRGARVNLEILQGLQSFPITIEADADFMFDVVP